MTGEIVYWGKTKEIEDAREAAMEIRRLQDEAWLRDNPEQDDLGDEEDED
tara:strand:+ start:2151 stop:2300 length:150 start_codon:yes stop_codon:yes gene_type:complete